MMGEELDVLEFARVSGVVFRGVGMVATLLKTKQILAGDFEAEMLEVVGAVIEDLFDENGWVR